MTKVIILGDEPKTGKKIELLFFINPNGDKCESLACPENFKFIELICKNYKGGNYDLMFAYSEDRALGLLYLGHFNDGIV